MGQGVHASMSMHSALSEIRERGEWEGRRREKRRLYENITDNRPQVGGECKNSGIVKHATEDELLEQVSREK